MTGLSEMEHAIKGFEVGGIGCERTLLMVKRRIKTNLTSFGQAFEQYCEDH